MPKVTFQYEDGTSTIVDVTAGENLLEVARKANVAIDAPCSGNGSCGKCRVRYISGELESEQILQMKIMLQDGGFPVVVR